MLKPLKDVIYALKITIGKYPSKHIFSYKPGVNY